MNEIADYFDDLADRWEAELCHTSPVQGAVARMAGIQEGSRVLDLGCGTGVMAPFYLRAGAEQVVALDLAPRMIEIAQKKFAHEDALSFQCCDALEYRDEQGFDAVVIYNAYPHFPHKSALAAHVRELLRPEGRFIVAHGMGKDALNAHHAGMSQALTADLGPAEVEVEAWRSYFDIDALVDTPLFYCFSGSVKHA